MNTFCANWIVPSNLQRGQAHQLHLQGVTKLRVNGILFNPMARKSTFVTESDLRVVITSRDFRVKSQVNHWSGLFVAQSDLPSTAMLVLRPSLLEAAGPKGDSGQCPDETKWVCSGYVPSINQGPGFVFQVMFQFPVGQTITFLALLSSHVLKLFQVSWTNPSGWEAFPSHPLDIDGSFLEPSTQQTIYDKSDNKDNNEQWW